MTLRHVQMSVLSKDKKVVGKVESLGGSFVRARDNTGRSHWIPLQWIEQIGDDLLLDRSEEQLKKQWRDDPPPPA